MTQARADNGGRTISDKAILEVVLEALRTTNAARPPSSMLPVSPDAALFGPGTPLDSLGLLTLLLDIEDGMQRAGWPVTLSDDRAMSQARSPFRSVPTLVDYIGRIVRE
jgi:hypothetical protein